MPELNIVRTENFNVVERYRGIIFRAAAGQTEDGDEAGLAQCLKEMRISQESAKRDIEAAKAYAAALAAERAAENLQDPNELNTAYREYQQIRKAVEALDDQIADLQQKRAAMGRKMNVAKDLWRCAQVKLPAGHTHSDSIRLANDRLFDGGYFERVIARRPDPKPTSDLAIVAHMHAHNQAIIKHLDASPEWQAVISKAKNTV